MGYSELFFAIIGFAGGILADWLLKEPILHRLNQFSIKRRALKAQREINCNYGINLGTRNTNTYLIEGNGVEEIQERNIKISIEDKYKSFPDKINELVNEIQKAEEEKTSQTGSGAWNGTIANIDSFSGFVRSEGIEEIKLEIRLSKAKYFQFLATTARADSGFRNEGLNSKNRLDVVGDFNDWANSPPTNQVNGLPVNLFVITIDSKILFTKRSQVVAIAPGVIAASVNENIHPIEDINSDQRTINFMRFVRRGLHEELGWNDDEYGGGTDYTKANIKILGFLADAGTTSYGIVGYADLPVTTKQIEQLKATMAKDRQETEGFIPINFDFKTLTEFIHKNGMYDATGIAICMCLIHKKHVTWQEINKRFRELQSRT